MSLRRLALCLLPALSLQATTGPSPAALAKVAPWVLERTAAGGQAEYTVVLADQADLSGAVRLRTKAEKGRFVRETLFQQARKTQEPILAELRARGVAHQPYYLVNLIRVTGGLELALALAERPDVARIDGNPTVRVALPQGAATSPGKAPNAAEAGLAYIRAPEVWALGTTGQNVVVGGADTGIRWTHDALKGKYRGWNGTTASHDYNWHDAIHGSTGPCAGDSAAPCDDYGHGTHTLGTAVGDDGGTNNIGVAPGARWIGCRNMDQGNGTPTTYLECFEWFLAPYPVGGTTAQGDPTKAPHVTNSSWECPASEGCNSGNWETMRLAVAAQRAAGIVTVASAGNSGPACGTVTDPPAMFDESYSVGSFNASTGTIAGSSSRGPVTADGSNRLKPDISAPGASVRSAWGSGDSAYTPLSGTSMAAPHVAGTVALVLSAAPALAGNVDAVETRLSQTAVPVPVTGTCGVDGSPNNVYGSGRLDALCAVLGNLASVSIGVAGSTVIGAPCLGGTATVTDTGGGTSTHQWGYRTTSGGAITPLTGKTGTSYQLACTDFPAPAVYFLVVTSTPQCGTAATSNEVTVTVSSTPVALQSFRID